MSEKTDAKPPRRGWRLLGRVFIVGIVAVLCLVLFVVVSGWTAFGKAPEGARLARMMASPQHSGSQFENGLPVQHDPIGAALAWMDESPVVQPHSPPPVFPDAAAQLRTPPETGLRITWLGHSTLYIEIDGHKLLIDPVWGERPSPVQLVGPPPRRWHAPPIALEDLPKPDAVIISHDHYDHLDEPTIRAIKGWDTRFLAPLGVGAHLEYWGVPAERIVELDWWDRHALGELELVCTPARHSSGRIGLDYNRTLWAGWAVLGPEHRVYYSGDTSMFPGFEAIGDRLGPFDATMIEVGAYNRAWRDWHGGPEQAVEAHQAARGGVLFPVHWGLFRLAPHGWTEPVERVIAAAEAAGVRVATPQPGQSVEPGKVSGVNRWWPELPWERAEDDPIRSSGLAPIAGSEGGRRAP